MPTLNELTESEFKNLLDEYFATPKNRTKMTTVEIKEIAKILNEKIDVPIIKETAEEKILIKIVITVDRFLYDNLPNEIYDLVRSVDRGIDDNEAKRLVKRLATLANEKIDIPYIPEHAEYVAMRLVIGIIINAARQSWDIYKSKKAVVNIEIPSEKEISNSELESMIF